MISPAGGAFLFVVFLCILYLLYRNVGPKGMLWGLAGMGGFSVFNMVANARDLFWVAFPIFVVAVLALALAGNKIIGLRAEKA